MDGWDIYRLVNKARYSDSPELLRVLSGHGHRDVVAWVLLNPMTPVEIVVGALGSPMPDWRWSAVRNSGVPFELLVEGLAGKGFIELVEFVVSHRFSDVRAYVEAQTSITGLPDVWVVKMFKTLVGVV